MSVVGFVLGFAVSIVLDDMIIGVAPGIVLAVALHKTKR